MRFPEPTPPPYDPLKWQKLPFPEKCRLVCQAWALQGYGTPIPVYGIYIVKILLLYVGGWCFFCSFTPGLGNVFSISSWWFEPVAFQKALLWSMAYEGLGLGCGSGPLTGRYYPPIGGFLYFARPGTTKMPLFPGLPVLGGSRRSYLDVGLYIVHYFFLLRALTAPELTPSLFIPTLILLPLLGLADKTLFLASRAEHYYSILVCFAFAGDWIAGSKAVQLAVWLWAATSKLNRHFPSVVAVMTSNNPFLRSEALRKRMYRHYPDDLRPSTLARVMAHLGTATEYSFPILLALSPGGWPTALGLAVMLGFHIYITSNVPMAVPIEWNVMVVYSAFFLFGHHGGVSFLSVSSPLLVGYLVVALVLVPLIGNFFPAYVSFLMSMRYYAGNWAYSVWLFKGDSSRKLDAHLTKTSPRVADQLRRFYDEKVIIGTLGKIIAFRMMHLHGRALHTLLPKAVDNIDDYEYLDGELVSGVVLGWNFGDGHLHNLQLLRAVQEQCGFAEGELRCIFVESQPMLGSSLAWTIADAKTGVMEQGKIAIDEILDRQPYPQNTAAFAKPAR